MTDANLGMMMETMTMYFYSSYKVVFLSSSWKVDSSGAYFGCIVATFAIALLVEFLSFGHSFLEHKNKGKIRDLVKEGYLDEAKHSSTMFRSFSLLIQFFRLFLSYLLMLIAMTFNIGLILTICVGLAFAYLLVGIKAEEQNHDREYTDSVVNENTPIKQDMAEES
jgi:hypothetical protein